MFSVLITRKKDEKQLCQNKAHHTLINFPSLSSHKKKPTKKGRLPQDKRLSINKQNPLESCHVVTRKRRARVCAGHVRNFPKPSFATTTTKNVVPEDRPEINEPHKSHRSSRMTHTAAQQGATSHYVTGRTRKRHAVTFAPVTINNRYRNRSILRRTQLSVVVKTLLDPSAKGGQDL